MKYLKSWLFWLLWSLCIHEESRKRNGKWLCNLADGPARNGFLPRWLFYQSGWSTSPEDGDPFWRLISNKSRKSSRNSLVSIESIQVPFLEVEKASWAIFGTNCATIARNFKRSEWLWYRKVIPSATSDSKQNTPCSHSSRFFVCLFCKHIAYWNTYINTRTYSQIRICMYVVHMTYKL